jgi:choice-of-anchor B domain-containing protein
MRKRTILVVLAPALAGASALAHGEKTGGHPAPEGTSGFDTRNVVLLSRVSLQALGATQGNDCWGYVSPSGREYALMGLREKTAVIEVTDPRNPVVVGEVAHAETSWSDIKTYGSFAYVVTDAVGYGMQVLDLSGVDNGELSLVATLTPSDFAIAHNLAVNEGWGHLYMVGATAPTDGVVAWSLADPASPKIVGSYSASGYVHDAHIVTMSDGPWAGREIAFLFCGEQGVEIVDVTDKSSMTRLGGATYDGLVYAHQGWFDADTNLLYQNDELDELEQGVPTTTRVWDVSDLENPVVVSTFSNQSPAIDHNLHTHEGFVYEANYRSGLRIWDARADPLHPTEVGHFDTYAANDDPDFGGAWGVYPYFPSGTVIISDLEGGLFVVDPTFAKMGGAPLAYSVPDGAPTAVPAGPTKVRLEISGRNGAAVVPGTPVLHVLDQEVRHNFPMASLGGGVWEATLPAGVCGDDIVYWFGADSTTGHHVHAPLSAPLEAFTAVIGPSPIKTFGDNFNWDNGWRAGLPSDTATEGRWIRAEPVGTAAQASADSDDPGTMCFVTGNGAPDDLPNAHDLDAGTTTLVSPRLRAAGGSRATIRCMVWWSNERPDLAETDTLRVEASNDDGATWTVIEELRFSTAGWEEMAWRLDDALPLTDTMRVRFVATDAGLGTLVEAGIDAFSLDVQWCQAGADLNGDGGVDGLDLGIMFSQWGGPGPADLNGDGTVDGLDIGLLVAAWK